jgi:hypothetical protein
LPEGRVLVFDDDHYYTPSTIQAAVYAGHKLARSLDEAPEGNPQIAATGMRQL